MESTAVWRWIGWVACAAALAGCGGGGDTVSGGPLAEEKADDDAAKTAPLSVATSQDIVVMLKPGFALEPLLSRHGLTLAESFGQRPIYRLRAPAGVSPATLVERLRGETSVRAAELNATVASPESRRVSVWAVGETSTGYALQSAPDDIGLPQALTLANGNGVRVALLDTGADLTHPELRNRWARSPSGAVLGRDFVDDDADPSEAGSRAQTGFGHGTHVAGIVARSAPGAQLMPVRVLDTRGIGNAWVLAEALMWAVDPDGNPNTDDGAHVINLSLGSTVPTELLKRVTAMISCEDDDDDDDDEQVSEHPGLAGDRARCANGHRAVVFAAAGNSGSETELVYPAAEQVKGSLAITAFGAGRQLASFANRGSWVGLAAPGDRIVSTVPGGGYGTWSGTSMATPWASGVAALLMSTPAPGGDATRPAPRQWNPEFVVKRLQDRARKLCGTSMLGLDAAAVLRDQPAPDPTCS
jgi:subtilisin family serine protease